MGARHRAEPQYDPALAPGVNNVAPELIHLEAFDEFECPHCGAGEPSIQQTIVVTGFRDASPGSEGYVFESVTSFDPPAHVEYRCNHCFGEVRIVTGHDSSLPIR